MDQVNQKKNLGEGFFGARGPGNLEFFLVSPYETLILVLLFWCLSSDAQLEAELDKMQVRAQKELVLLHRSSTKSPQNTVEWLVNRGWCSAHHHVRLQPTLPSSVFYLMSFLVLEGK